MASLSDSYSPHPAFGRRGQDARDPGAESDRRQAEPHALASPTAAIETYPFATAAGRRLGLGLTLRPLVDLVTGRIIAQRVTEIGRWVDNGLLLDAHERDTLDPGDLERLDCEVFQRGLTLLTAAGADAGLVPTAYRTVIHSQTRFRYLSVCLQAPVTERTRLLAELTGVDASTPPDRLAEAVALIGVGRRGVVVHAPPDPRAMRAMGVFPIAGISFDLGETWAPERCALDAALAAAGAITDRVVLEGLDRSASGWALEHGATHAVFNTRAGSTH